MIPYRKFMLALMAFGTVGGLIVIALWMIFLR